MGAEIVYPVCLRRNQRPNVLPIETVKQTFFFFFFPSTCKVVLSKMLAYRVFIKVDQSDFFFF